MAPSKAHLYLVSFQRLGLVRQDPATARYSLGPMAIRLGIAAINQTDLVEVAGRHIDAAVARAGTSISVSVWSNRGPTIVHRRDGAQPVPISIRLGFVLPLLSSATGRVFLAHLPEAAWRSLAQAEDDIVPGQLASVGDMLPGIRAAGHAVTQNNIHGGFFGVCAPVLDGDGAICGAVTALGLSGRLDLTPRGVILPTITRLARDISREMGDRSA